MKTIATLGPSTRLVVFQFLMRNDLVPAIIPPRRNLMASPLPPVSGVRVLESTPRLSIFSLACKLDCGKDYELVDVWQKPHETDWRMSFVRFVFCNKEHLAKLSPDFVAKSDKLKSVLVDLVSKNLWATEGYLNPYFEKDGKPSGHQVLMLGCAGRTPDTEVFSGGRDENNRGVGPKILMSVLSSEIDLDDNNVVLAAPTLLQKPIIVDPDQMTIQR